MSFDNLCKLLAEKHPARFAAWLLGEEVTTLIEILKTELSIEPIRADSVTLLKTSGRILHLEFQTTWISDPPTPLRLLDYWVRLYRLYRLPIHYSNCGGAAPAE
jgi:predicted transposase YdaD